MLVINITWENIPLFADGGSYAYNFTHHGDGTHHSHAAKGYMRHTDIPASHKKVCNVTGVEAAVWNRVGGYFLFNRLRQKGFPIEFIGVLRVMQVNAPGSREGCIGIGHLIENICFGQDHLTKQASRFTLSGYVCDPV